MNTNTKTYISDLRFQNEFKVLKDHGFICIKIDNTQIDNLDGYSNHQSDKDLDDFNGWDYIIKNTNSLKELYDQLDHLFEKIVN